MLSPRVFVLHDYHQMFINNNNYNNLTRHVRRTHRNNIHSDNSNAPIRAKGRNMSASCYHTSPIKLVIDVSTVFGNS